jgi:capsular polysaccharide biosynthesis protein
MRRIACEEEASVRWRWLNERVLSACPRNEMEVAIHLRELWRRRVLVGVVAILAVLVGMMIAFRVSVLPPKLESRSYEVGVATARMLVDTPESVVVGVSPKGSETLGTRASLLSTLMTEGDVKADIARRVGLRPKQLEATAEFGAESGEAPPQPKPGPRSQVLTTRVLTNTVGEQLPIIEVEAQAPDAKAAVALAAAAVTSLSESLDSKAASEDVKETRRLSVSPLGPPKVQEAGRGPRGVLGLAASIFFFVAGCGLILLFLALARSWRQAAASEQGFQAHEEPVLDLAPGGRPTAGGRGRRSRTSARDIPLSLLTDQDGEDDSKAGTAWRSAK